MLVVRPNITWPTSIVTPSLPLTKVRQRLDPRSKSNLVVLAARIAVELHVGEVRSGACGRLHALQRRAPIARQPEPYAVDVGAVRQAKVVRRAAKLLHDRARRHLVVRRRAVDAQRQVKLAVLPRLDATGVDQFQRVATGAGEQPCEIPPQVGAVAAAQSVQGVAIVAGGHEIPAVDAAGRPPALHRRAAHRAAARRRRTRSYIPRRRSAGRSRRPAPARRSPASPRVASSGRCSPSGRRDASACRRRPASRSSPRRRSSFRETLPSARRRPGRRRSTRRPYGRRRPPRDRTRALWRYARCSPFASVGRGARCAAIHHGMTTRRGSWPSLQGRIGCGYDNGTGQRRPASRLIRRARCDRECVADFDPVLGGWSC